MGSTLGSGFMAHLTPQYYDAIETPLTALVINASLKPCPHWGL